MYDVLDVYLIENLIMNILVIFCKNISNYLKFHGLKHLKVDAKGGSIRVFAKHLQKI